MHFFSFLFSYLRYHKLVSSLLCFFVLFISCLVLAFGYVIKASSQNISLHISVLGCLLSIGSFFKSYLSQLLSQSVLKQLSSHLFEARISQKIPFFDHHNPALMVSDIQQNLSQVELFLSKSFPIFIRNLIMVLGGLSFMAFISLRLTYLSIIIASFITVPIFIIGKRLKKYTNCEKNLTTSIQNYMHETFAEIKTIKSFCFEKEHHQHFSQMRKEHFKAAKEYALRKSFLSSFVMILIFAGIGILYYFATQEMKKGILHSDEFVAFLFYLVLVTASSGSFGELITEIIKTSHATAWINQHLIKPTPQKLIKQFSESKGIIGFHHVFFSYNSQQCILEDITCSITPGERIALVGRSGSGKSTLFSLLLKFYEPQNGSIYLDGKDIKNVDHHALRQRIGWVGHNPSLFTGTVYENISYGKKNVSFSHIEEAAHQANILDFITSLPQGFKTPLGIGGLQLSQGEKQRLAIARVFLKNPEIFLFDEATNALDLENEIFIQASLASFQKTSLIITHRLSSVLLMSRVMFLEQHKIQDIDTHDNLLRKNTSYRSLCHENLKE